MKINKDQLLNFLWLSYIAVIFLAMDNYYAIDRLLSIGGNSETSLSLGEHLRQGVFIIEYCIAIVILYACSKIKRTIGIPLLIILWGLTFVELGFHLVMGKAASLTDIANLNAAIDNSLQASKLFYNQTMQALVSSLLLFVPLLLRSATNKHPQKMLSCLVPACGLLAIYIATLIARGEPALIGFPKGFAYALGSGSLKVNDVLKKFNPDIPLIAATIPPAAVNKIIVIVDESVAYEELEKLNINNPYLVDYGRAFSAANCSAASNYIIRRSGWFRQADTLATPAPSHKLQLHEITSLFGLAKNNGYKTIYFDNQGVLKNVSFSNFFDDHEKTQIDQVIETDPKTYASDLLSLTTLAKLPSTTKQFIFINKIGTHFPYQYTIAPELRTKDKLANYRKSLELNTKTYLQTLIDQLDSNTLVFYTSDHGQNFTGHATHCNTGDMIVDSEYSVPLFIITKNSAILARLQANKTAYMNNLTHLEFSESIRNALGYSVAGFASVFKTAQQLAPQYCGLYGPPNTLFGILPNCHPL